MDKKQRINDQIPEGSVRLIDEEGTQYGIVSLEEALRISESKGLDLVEVSPDSDPRVVKIMDFGKHRYAKKKKLQEAKKKQKNIQLKTVRMTPRTDIHDYEFKLKDIRKFLNMGNKVKIMIKFKGRELAHKDRGMLVIEKLNEDLKDIAKAIAPSEFEGRNLVAIYCPIKTK